MFVQALFAALAAILVVSSLLVILHKSPVSSALFLVSAFCSLAAIYLTLHAEFLGLVQVLVYAGAIMVLFLFVIMYLNLKTDLEGGAQIAVRRGIGWIVGAVLVAETVLYLSHRWALGPIAPPEALPPGNTQAIGQVLYSRYLFPFEITSVILLVAMVGAIVISRPRLFQKPESHHRIPESAPLTSMPAAMDAPPPVPAAAPTSQETEAHA